MTVPKSNDDILEVSVPEVIENNDCEDGVETQRIYRKWNYGSTQTSDDMYLGGLMCE